MTLVANVKGYINWDKWWVFDQLMEYCEIVKNLITTYASCEPTWSWVWSYLIWWTAKDDVLEELNKYPINYYNKFNWESRLFTQKNQDNCLFRYYQASRETMHMIYFDLSDNTWKYKSVRC